MKTVMRHSMTVLSLAALLSVAGCKAANTPIVGAGLDSLNGKHDATEERLSTSAANAIAEGKTEEALALYERLYEHHGRGFAAADHDSRDIALNYAQLLRKTGDGEAALKVLSPLVKSRRGDRVKNGVDPVILNEYAASNLETGNFKTAEKILHRVLDDKKAAKAHADAYSLLGVSLDAQGRHKEAEEFYRKALKGWKGDPTAIMNNLGLCLASQGLFDESLKTLRLALVMAPRKQEIAHNIQLVKDLKASYESGELDKKNVQAQPPSLPPVFKDAPGSDAQKKAKNIKKKKKKKAA